MSGTERPNILWYCADQMRSDTIHAFGNSSIHTPNLDLLAKNGEGFTQTYCQAPICTPSRASFLTGRYPAAHQVHRNGNAFFPSSEVLVTRLLADAGYDCGLVGKLHLAGAQNEIEPRTDDGYRYFVWSQHPRPNIKGDLYPEWLSEEKGMDPIELFKPVGSAYGIGLPAELHQTTWCSEMAIRFITEDRDKPCLLSVNPFAPHPSFYPPQEYLDRYNPEDLPYPLFQEHDLERQKAFQEIDQETIHAINPLIHPEATGGCDFRLMKACYYAEITLLDEQFGRIIDTLRETNQLENTIIIFSSDHGELLGDHGLLYKGCRFFEALTHVPLIISGPGFLKNTRSGALVESIDLAPTLLEAAGIEIPYYMQGKSLGSLLTGTTQVDKHKSHVICEYHDSIAAGFVNTVNNVHEISWHRTIDDLLIGRDYDASHETMYFDGRYKIAVYHGHEIGEIYDLQSDPGEFDNLWDNSEYKDLKLELLKKHFDAHAATTSAGIKRIKAY